MFTFFKNKKAIGGLSVIAIVLIGCFALAGLTIYTNAPKTSGNIIVQPGGGSASQDTYFPVAWNIQAFEGTTKVAATIYVFDQKVAYPELEIAGSNYLASVSYTGGASQEIVTKASLDSLQAAGRFNGTTFWIYTKPTNYVESWAQVQVLRNKYSATEDQEIGVTLTKAGSFVESGSTTTTESATAPAWTTSIISTYTKPVVVRFVDSNASSSEISSVAFKIDGVSQTVNKVSGGWYSNVIINGNRTLVVTATRKTAADLNASVVTYINELNPSGPTDFYNYGTQLFTETNTD